MGALRSCCRTEARLHVPVTDCTNYVRVAASSHYLATHA